MLRTTTRRRFSRDPISNGHEARKKQFFRCARGANTRDFFPPSHPPTLLPRPATALLSESVCWRTRRVGGGGEKSAEVSRWTFFIYFIIIFTPQIYTATARTTTTTTTCTFTIISRTYHILYNAYNIIIIL